MNENPIVLLSIPCRFEGCEERWALAVDRDGDIERSDLVERLTVIATHCREVHGCEESALRSERLALTL